MIRSVLTKVRGCSLAAGAGLALIAGNAMAAVTGTYADVFTAVDFTTFTSSLAAIAVVLVGVWMLFAAIRKGKQITSKV